MATVPVIDISPLFKGDHGDTDQIFVEMKSCLQTVGAFYIAGHGIPVETSSGILQQTRDFFSLPLEKKNALSFRHSKAFRGYFHKGAETTSGTADVKEGLFFGPESEEEGSPMAGANRFPDKADMPCFEIVVNSMMSSLAELGMLMTNTFAKTIDLDKEFVKKNFNPPFYNMSLWHYPPNPLMNGKWGIGPHTDYEAFTFLLQDNVGGLEIKTRDGLWVNVPPKEGTILAMVGDVTECWTRGFYQAPIHRVRSSTTQSRYSAAFFFQPNLSTIVNPLDIPLDNDKEYTPTRADIVMPFHYGKRLHLSYIKSFNQLQDCTGVNKLQ